MTSRNRNLIASLVLALVFSLVALVALTTTSCTSASNGTVPPGGTAPTVTVEGTARDVYASLGGVLVAAQAKYKATCTADPNLADCLLINKAGAAQNMLGTSIENYCGWTVGSVPVAGSNAICTPNTTLVGNLTTAISNANTFLTELEGVTK